MILNSDLFLFVFFSCKQGKVGFDCERMEAFKNKTPFASKNCIKYIIRSLFSSFAHLYFLAVFYDEH